MHLILSCSKSFKSQHRINNSTFINCDDQQTGNSLKKLKYTQYGYDIKTSQQII